MTRKMLVAYKGQVDDHIVHPENGVGAWKLSQLAQPVTFGTGCEQRSDGAHGPQNSRDATQRS
jgi:hypothetical protein